MRFFSTLLLTSALFFAGCNQNKDAERDAERAKQRAAAKAKQEKIDKAKQELFKAIKEKKDIFEKTRIADIGTKDGKKVYKDSEIYEWAPNKLTLYSKDGSLDTINFSELDEATRDELGFDKKLYSRHKSYLAYVKRNTVIGGTASVAVNTKKTDADLRKDAEAATTEHRYRYTYYTLNSESNGNYRLKLHLLSISSSGIVRMSGIFNNSVKGKGPYQLGTDKPLYSAKSYGKGFKAGPIYKKELTLYGGDSMYFFSKAAAVQSRYEALKFRNK
ncbi:MAG: hypothetical protein MK132_01360 [Lentisphaerales bacterium]|nr:hypothetical protein [Lentisphaerales bacterium]